jgi:hypothetical protein
MIGDTLRWLADRIDPPKPRPAPDYPMRVTGSAFSTDDGQEQRREDAMSLVDDDTIGYLLVRVKDHGAFAKADVAIALLDEMWPAIKETLCRVVLEGERVYQ